MLSRAVLCIQILKKNFKIFCLVDKRFYCIEIKELLRLVNINVVLEWIQVGLFELDNSFGFASLKSPVTPVILIYNVKIFVQCM